MKLKTLSTFVLALGLAATGCSKKKEEPAAAPATEAAKPTEAKPAAEAPKAEETKPAETKPTEAAAAPAAAGAIASDEEYVKEGKAALGKFVEAFTAAGDDCDKLAASINALAKDPKVLAANEYEKAHPDVKKKFEEAAKGETEKVMAVAMPALEKCKSNAAVMDAFSKLK